MAKEPKTNAASNVFRAVMSTADPQKLVIAAGRNAVVGIRIPFALEFLFNCNILPLGVVIELAGEAGSTKTTLSYEFGRMFYQYGGWTEMFLTEGKISPDLASSLMGYADECLAEGKHPPFACHNSTHMAEWQAYSISRVQQILALMQKGDKAAGLIKGAFQPVQFVIDSIMGQNLAETNSNISADGSSGRSYAIEANSLTQYLKAIQADIEQGPFLLTLINHAKPGTPVNAFTPPPLNTPGGKQVRFQCTFRVLLSKATKALELDDDATPSLYKKGYSITMSLLKSSLGEDTCKIVVPYRWRYLPDASGVVRQRGEFLWNAALVGLLMQETSARQGATDTFKRMATEKLDTVVHFRKLAGDAFVSKTFGATQQSPISAAKLGQLIQADSNIINGLRNLFGIKRYTVWDGTQDYFKLRRDGFTSLAGDYLSVPAKSEKTRAS